MREVESKWDMGATKCYRNKAWTELKGSDNPHKVGHRKAFTAIYAYRGIYGIAPRPDQMHLIGSYVVRGAGCY
eukprot:4045072-Pleurochrysis_carterae.AAC.2